MTDWLTDYTLCSEILWWKTLEFFCPNGGKICVQDKYMSNFASDPVLCQKKPTK